MIKRLIVVEIVVEAAVAIILQILQHRSLHPNREAPAFAESDRHPVENHLPAVQIPRQGKRSRGDSFCLEIVSSAKLQPPLLSQGHTSVKSEGLHNITSYPVIRIAERIIESEVPRDTEIIVHRRHHLPSGGRIVEIVGLLLGKHIGIGGRNRCRCAIDVIHCPGGRIPRAIPRIAERGTDTGQPAYLAFLPHELIDLPSVGIHLIGIERCTDV